MSSVTPSWISCRREASPSRGRVRITPHSTSVSSPPALLSPRTTPYPVVAVPGSIPSTITRLGSGPASGLRHFRHVHVEVGVDLLYVVEVLERAQQLHERL